MKAVEILVTIVHLIFCISLIAIVLLQSGKTAGLSGSISGGAETFFGKNKARTIDSMLEKYTKFVAIAFLVSSILLYLLLK